MKVLGAGKEWRVRPVRATNGRIQGYAVEHRSLHRIWREWALVSDHGRAMDLARHLAYNVVVVA